MQEATPPALQDQAAYWDSWNLKARNGHLPPTSRRQGELVEDFVAGLGRRDLSIIDIGCGTGWMSERLLPFGSVTGIDITSATIAQAAARVPEVRFLCADIYGADLPPGHFDVAVCLEVLAHAGDQPGFVRRLASLLRPGGALILATQNRPVLERWSAVAPPDRHQIRQWVDRGELSALLEPCFERLRIRSIVPVGDRGLLGIVNSPRLNAALARVVAPARIERAKERCMLGHSLVATAIRRGADGVTSARR